jgi:hypothetical protein
VTLLEEAPKYRIELLDHATLLFGWSEVDDLTVEEYMDAVRRIAALSEQHGARAVVIDTRRRRVDVGFDESWWRREILPAYRRAGVARFAHVVAEPDAPGEWAQVPDGVTFRMGSFPGLEEALRWTAEAARPDDKENEMNPTVLDETDQYRIVSIDGDTPTVLLDWKRVEGQLSVHDDRRAVRRFAELCMARKPDLAVIDVHLLEDQEERGNHDHEPFEPWWLREIAPAYHDAGIAGLAIVIGDPNAPGETDDLPPGMEFKRGYFGDLAAALAWRPTD